VPPALHPTVDQTLILENLGATAIAFGAWGVSLGQISPSVDVTLDPGISNYDTLLDSLGAEYLSLPPVSAPTTGGFCLAATAQTPAEAPWDVHYRRPRALVSLDKITPVPAPGTPVESYAKLVVMTGGMGTDQQICFYVSDGVNPYNRVCTDIPAWVPSSAHTLKGCISSTGQMRIYLDGSTTPATPNLPPVLPTSSPDFQGAQVFVGSNEYGAHVWSGWVKKALVCRDDGNIAQCQ